ncbi:MAG: aminotransferase [Pseudomonadota bacterium]
MNTPLPSMTATTFAPPVMEARRWIAEAPRDRALLNLSQAAPTEPPPELLVQAMAEAVLNDPAAHVYGPVLGLPALREAVAARWSADYAGQIASEDVAVTAGCNQAFCSAIAALARPGDNVILPVPWYFNHAMWLEMMGIEARPLASAADICPDPEALKIDARTRAIVLVTPNNPTGVEYAPALIEQFAEVARRHGIHLILDETYRDFGSSEGPAHALFTDPEWREIVVHLYSFSKVFRLTGHRTGVIIAAPTLLTEAEKFLDTVAICPPQVGQVAALAGLERLDAWVAGERAEVLRRGEAARAGLSSLPGWRLRGAGAYFAYVEHPFADPSDHVARRLVREAGVLLLPGTMFAPTGDAAGARSLRIAFANADTTGIAELVRRLAALDT